MSIKFNKQIANTLAKIINGYRIQRRIQNPVKRLRLSFFRKSLLASETNSESCQTSKIDLFAKIVKNLKSFTIVCKNLHLGCLIRFWMCFWRTNSYIFGLYVAQSNGSKYGWNISKHIALRPKFYVAASRALFAHLAPALFFSKGVFRTPSNF